MLWSHSGHPSKPCLLVFSLLSTSSNSHKDDELGVTLAEALVVVDSGGLGEVAAPGSTFSESVGLGEFLRSLILPMQNSQNVQSTHISWPRSLCYQDFTYLRFLALIHKLHCNYLGTQ